MNAKPFLVAAGLVMIAAPTAYLTAPTPFEVPASVSRQAEHLTPLARPTVQKLHVPKAVVKSKKSAKPKRAALKQGRRSEERDFATDLRNLQDCTVLRELRASGKETSGAYEQKLKWSLIPWFLKHCGLS